jgi:stage III sporulation protein AB
VAAVLTVPDLREVGAVLVAAVAWQAGRLLVRPLALRPCELAAWQTFLARLEAEVAWEGRELADAMARAAQHLDGDLVAVVTGIAEEAGGTGRVAGSPPRHRLMADIWTDGVNQAPWLMPEDRARLRALAPVLGRYSREEQARQLRAVRDSLKGAEAEARTRRDRQGRALATLVTLAGVALVVLLV